MKKLWKYLILSLTMTMFFSLNVYAQDTITKANFDYEWYLEQHPDLAAIVDPADKETIWNFYVNIGAPAGWLGRVSKDSLISIYDFDAQRYALENQDVVSVLGSDAATLYQHYINHGIHEGRKGYSTSEIVNAQIQIYTLADQITANCVSTRDKIKAVHDWMVCNIAYDYDNYLNRTIPRRSYDISGPILYGKSVCQGYAETFDYFMGVLGIDCKMVIGAANNGSWGGHAWNHVNVDGTWLYIDVTWDDPVPDMGNYIYGYRYYLTTDPTFGGDHRMDYTY